MKKLILKQTARHTLPARTPLPKLISNGLFFQKCSSMLIPYLFFITSGHVSGLDEIMLFISVKASGFLLKNVDLYCLKRFPSLLNAKNNSGLLPLLFPPRLLVVSKTY